VHSNEAERDEWLDYVLRNKLLGNSDPYALSPWDYAMRGDSRLKTYLTEGTSDLTNSVGDDRLYAPMLGLMTIPPGADNGQRIGSRIRVRYVSFKFHLSYTSPANGALDWFRIYPDGVVMPLVVKIWVDQRSNASLTGPTTTADRWTGTPNLAGSSALGTLCESVGGSINTTPEAMIASYVPEANRDRFQCVQTHVCKDPVWMLVKPPVESLVPGVYYAPEFTIVPGGEYWTYNIALDQEVRLVPGAVSGITGSLDWDMFVTGPHFRSLATLPVKLRVCCKVVYEDC
jgi:hypothetical protein